MHICRNRADAHTIAAWQARATENGMEPPRNDDTLKRGVFSEYEE
jgi:hypothetical protein